MLRPYSEASLDACGGKEGRMENLINPIDLLDQHSGDLYRVAVMAAEMLGQEFVPGGARFALPVSQCTSHSRLGNLFSKSVLHLSVRPGLWLPAAEGGSVALPPGDFTPALPHAHSCLPVCSLGSAPHQAVMGQDM